MKGNMHQLLDEYICKKYPKIFVDRHKSEMESCMHWGLAIGNGWLSLIDELCRQIQHHIDNPPWELKPSHKIKDLWNKTVWNHAVYPLIKDWEHKTFTKAHDLFCLDVRYQEPTKKIPQLVALQVKEKFSGLRFYAQGGDETTSAMITLAESLSYRICEECGVMNDTVGRNQDGWIQTTCSIHKRVDVANFSINGDDALAKIWEKIRKENEAKKSL
jgi:hypothetical protein